MQASPIEFKVMDHDVITADDTIGLVHVDLSPLLMRLDFAEPDQGEQLLFQGWLPLFDTLNGIRGERERAPPPSRARGRRDATLRPALSPSGELRLSVRLHVLTSDVNPWGLSSAGVLFSSLSELAPGVGRVVSVRARARALSHSRLLVSRRRESERPRARRE